MSVCATVLLFAAIGQIPAGSCVLTCELKAAFVAVETATSGKAMLNDDGGWFTAYRIDGKWHMVLESDPEQCWLGGAEGWVAQGGE